MPIFYAGQTGQEKVQSIFDFGTLDTVAYASGDILTSSAWSLGYRGIGGHTRWTRRCHR